MVPDSGSFHTAQIRTTANTCRSHTDTYGHLPQRSSDRQGRHDRDNGDQVN
jgi:hypothetical protein